MIEINNKKIKAIEIGGKTVTDIKDHITGKHLYWIPAAPVATFTGVRVMRYNGEVISLSHWQADDIPVSEAVGVAIGDGSSATGHRFALFKTFMQNTSATPCRFTSSNTVLIPGMYTTTVYADSITDFDGKANSAAVLTALAGGTLANANVCVWCNGIRSPWGENAYCPSNGQMALLYNNAAAINDIMTYIGGDSFVTSNSEFYWTSTQYNANSVWGKVANVNNQLNKGASSNAHKALAVFDY